MAIGPHTVPGVANGLIVDAWQQVVQQVNKIPQVRADEQTFKLMSTSEVNPPADPVEDATASTSASARKEPRVLDMELRGFHTDALPVVPAMTRYVSGKNMPRRYYALDTEIYNLKDHFSRR